MKKILFSGAVLIYCLLIAVSSHAQKMDVPSDVQRAFDEHFKNASVARWVPIQDSYVATFTQGQGYRDAYFTTEGEFKGVGRYIGIDLLPVTAQEKIRSNYSNFDLNQLYQFDAVDNGISFYAVLNNGKNELILKMDGTGDVSYSKRNKIKDQSKMGEPLASNTKH
ncbi:MAG TPA: hypothetical protein VGQ53_06045 [Chitinophagaceae bacterium]|jgi:hypothetical protein|nr:hypothetical protein [Chitinophagaceae bacterium]